MNSVIDLYTKQLQQHKKFTEYISDKKNDFPGWYVVSLFYQAVIIINIEIFKNCETIYYHSGRKDYINRVHRDIFSDYKYLEKGSRKARYVFNHKDPFESQIFKNSYSSLEEYEQSLDNIKEEFN